MKLTWAVWCIDSLFRQAHRHVSMLTIGPYSQLFGRKGVGNVH